MATLERFEIRSKEDVAAALEAARRLSQDLGFDLFNRARLLKALRALGRLARLADDGALLTLRGEASDTRAAVWASLEGRGSRFCSALGAAPLSGREDADARAGLKRLADAFETESGGEPARLRMALVQRKGARVLSPY